MTKPTRSMAAITTVLTLCAGGALAQTKPADKTQPAPKPVVAKPVAAVKPPMPTPAASAKTTNSKPVASVPVKPATAQTTKPAAPAKPANSKPAPAKSVAGKTAPQKVAAPKQAAPKPTAESKPATAAAAPAPTPSAEDNAPKRDPFVALVNNRTGSGGPILPPGKAGLVVATVRIDGTVKSGTELLAVVSNPERHVYFVREGDQLYDGNVEKIDLDGVTFHENSKDAFGKPVVRTVTKRIYASAGERQ